MMTGAIKHFFLCTNRPKSWASAFDYALKLNDQPYNSVKIILFSRSGIFHTTHFFRDRRLKRIARSKGLAFSIYKFSQLKVIQSSVKAIEFAYRVKIRKLDLLTPFHDNQINQICKSYWGAKIGSSHYSVRSIPSFDLYYAVYICGLYEQLLKSAFGKMLIRSMGESVNYLWNGREPEEASLLFPLLQNNFKYKIIERGSLRDSYELWDHSPHSSEDWWAKLVANWKRLEYLGFPDKAKAHALDYAASKSSGYDSRAQKDWISLMGERKKLTRNHPYIVFFTSSTKEMSPFLEFEHRSPLGDQFSAVSTLIEVANELGLELIIRRHPNSVSKNGIDGEKSLWDVYRKHPFVTIIEPKDEFDSYSIAEKSMCSFVWISSIGFDLIYRRLNSRALGPAYWAYKEVFRAFDKKSIIKAISEDIENIDREELVYNYGNLMCQAGQKNILFHKITKSGAWIRSSNENLAANDFLQIKECLKKYLG